MSLDLHPYGIDLVLTSVMKELPLQRGTALLTAAATETKDAITIDGVVYKIDGPSLGQGSYGKTYKCIAPDGKPVAIKAIHQPIGGKDDIHSFLTEIIIQIVLLETSKDQPGGPFVPNIFKVGFNKTNKHGYIVSELMYRTVRSLIRDETPVKNDVIIPEMVRQIGTILDFFGKKVEFNHRDCKCDNLMYVKDAEGKRVYKLIDFGYSCLKWNNLELRGKIAKLSGACYRKGRDLTQLLYELTLYHTISFNLLEWLKSNLQVHIDKTCSLQDCDLPVPVRNWQNTYTLLNAKDIEPVYNTTAVIERVKLLQEMEGFKTRKNKPAPVKVPSPKKKTTPKEKIVVRIHEHKTGKLLVSFAIKPKTPFSTVFDNFKKFANVAADLAWAKDKVLVFKHYGSIIKPSETPADFGMTSPADIKVAAYDDEAAAKAAQAPAPAAAAPPAPPAPPAPQEKKCPPQKVLNPKTGRCVSRLGAVGKAAIEAKVLAIYAAAGVKPHAKDCPPGKVINPKTGRCVKEDGAAGKAALGKKRKTRKNK